MNKEELKHKLRSAHFAHEQIATLSDHLQELRSLALKVTPAYSQSPGGGSGNAQKLENSVAKIIEQEKLIVECCNELCAQLAEVRALVALLPMGPMRLVMQRRYLNYQKWEQIAAELHYSWQNVHRLHSKALDYILHEVNKRNT